MRDLILIIIKEIFVKNEMSDAQVDGGDSGARAEDAVGGFIGEQDNAGSVRWYGLYSLAMSVGTMFFWMFFNNLTYVGGNADFYYTQIEVFLPVFICWMMVSFFDGEFMRMVFADVVSASFGGPFAANWVVLAGFYLAGEGSYLDSITFWIYFAGYAAFSIFQMIVQILMLPAVMEWAEEAPTLDNDQEKSLLAILF